MTKFWQRFRGVKSFKKNHRPLYFPQCKMVHTFGLRAPLHLLWLDDKGVLIKTNLGVKPNRVISCFKAFGVVEIKADNSFLDYRVGHKFCLKGQALVEAAVVMPVLFLLLFGFIELGLLLHKQQQLTYVVQHATQIGSLTNNDLKITGAIESFYQNSDLSVALTNTKLNTNVVITSAERRYSDLLKLQLTQPYTLSIPFFSIKAFSLNAQASARVLCQNNIYPYQCD